MVSFCRRSLFFNYVNTIDMTKKIQFIMEAAEDVLELLDLKFIFDN